MVLFVSKKLIVRMVLAQAFYVYASAALANACGNCICNMSEW